MTIDNLKTMLSMIERDLDTFENKGKRFRVCKHVKDFGLVLPLDWTDEWCPDLLEAWDKFMCGQTFCEHGFYIRDVRKFLYSKLREAK